MSTSGRLSEIFGERALSIDRISRRKGLLYAAKNTLEISKKDLEILKLNNVSKIKSPSNYLVLIETGDDVIPFKYTLDFYKGCNFCIVNGGSHSFDSFKKKLEIISKFMQL